MESLLLKTYSSNTQFPFETIRGREIKSLSIVDIHSEVGVVEQWYIFLRIICRIHYTEIKGPRFKRVDLSYYKISSPRRVVWPSFVSETSEV